MKAQAKDIRPGQWYRAAGTTAFGRPPQEWEVQHISTATDGLLYVTMIDREGRQTKTVAANALRDRSLYVLAAEAPPPEPTPPPLDADDGYYDAGPAAAVSHARPSRLKRWFGLGRSRD